MARIIDGETIAITNDALIIYRGSDLYDSVVGNLLRPEWEEFRQWLTSWKILFNTGLDDERGAYIAFICPTHSETPFFANLLGNIEKEIDQKETEKEKKITETMPQDEQSIIVCITNEKRGQLERDAFTIGGIKGKSARIHRGGQILTFSTKLGMVIKARFVLINPIVQKNNPPW